MIFYFTGTGNSLYIAKQIENTPISIPQAMRGEENMAVILDDLAARRNMISEVTDTDRAAYQQFLERMSQMPTDAWQNLLRVTEGCVGCGICERVCPSSSIHMADGKAVHIPGNCQLSQESEVVK